jgi:hypothetical protein
MNHDWKRQPREIPPDEAHAPHWMKIKFGCNRCGGNFVTSRYHVSGEKYTCFPPTDDELDLYKVSLDCDEELVKRIMTL